MFFNTRSIFLYDESVFRLGNGAMCGGIICLILSFVIVIYYYINNGIMKEQIDEMFNSKLNNGETDKQE